MKRASFMGFSIVLAVSIAGLLANSRTATAQSGSRGGAGSSTRAADKDQPHYAVLWEWLQKAKYTKWNGFDGKPAEFEEGGSPHGALVKIYVDKVAEGDLEGLPHRSVIVKENYSPDKELMAITIMQRNRGYDPENDDWYYAKYMPNGKIGKTPPEKNSMPIAGKFRSCIGCHSGAGGNDFVFTND